MNTITLTCQGCGQFFQRALKDHNRNVRLGYKTVACSKACVHLAKGFSTLVPVTKICPVCSNEFIRKPHDHTNIPIYCSVQCSNKSKITHGKYTAECSICGSKKLSSPKSKYCNDCKKEYAFNSKRDIDYGKTTLAELRKMYSTAQYHAKIRGMSRAKYKRYHNEFACENCGYDLHIDICHIKGVSEFPETATLDEVNHIDNLLGLDKRCHWEFDNGYLTLEEIRGKRQAPPEGGA